MSELIGVVMAVCGVIAIVGALKSEIKIHGNGLPSGLASGLAAMLIALIGLWMQVVNRLLPSWPPDLHTDLPAIFWIVVAAAIATLVAAIARIWEAERLRLTLHPSELFGRLVGIAGTIGIAGLATYSQSWYAGHSLNLNRHPNATVSVTIGTPGADAGGTVLPVAVTTRNAGNSPLVVIGSALWMTVEDSATPRVSPATSLISDKSVQEAFFSEYRPAQATGAAAFPAVLAVARPIPVQWQLNPGEEYHSSIALHVPQGLSSKLIRLNAQVVQANPDLLQLAPSDDSAARQFADDSGISASAWARELGEPSWLVAMSRPTLALFERWDLASDELSVVGLFQKIRGSPLLSRDQQRSAAAYYGITYTAAHMELTLPRG